ncbi:hypothetical protein ACJX0J_013022, partial [Zea mays]
AEIFALNRYILGITFYRYNIYFITHIVANMIHYFILLLDCFVHGIEDNIIDSFINIIKQEVPKENNRFTYKTWSNGANYAKKQIVAFMQTIGIILLICGQLPSATIEQL